MKIGRKILLSALIVSFILMPALHYARASSEYTGPQSIILMIGDGMGYEEIKLARWIEVGKDANLTMEILPYQYSVETHSADSAITDSSAAATAYATGEKTNNNWVSIAPNGTVLKSILEIARDSGKTTGVVTTTSVQHGTPAPFLTHTEDRTNFTSITQQIVEDSGVDVLMGGGRSYFSAEQIDFMAAKGYAFADDKATLDATDSDMLLGLFAQDQMIFEQQRDVNVIPSLVEMTNKALDILSLDQDGFFLLIEGGRIDHAGHDNNMINNALETIAFDKAVGVALDYVETHSNTILIVTADHETGGLMITGDSLSGALPSDENTELENRALRIARANTINVTWSTDSHTAKNVALFIYGTGFEHYALDDVIDNTQVFDIMDDYYSGRIENQVTQLPISVELMGIIAGTGIIIVLAAYLIKLKKYT